MIQVDENKTEKESISWKRFWVELWRLLASFRKLFGTITIVTLLAAILDLGKPYILKLVIDNLNNFSKDQLFFLLKLIVLYLATDEFRSFISYLGDRWILKLLVKVEYFLGMTAQEKLVFLSLGYHERQNTGAKIIKIERGVEKISEFLNNIFWEVLPTVFQLVFTLVALFWSDWRIGLSFLVFAPLFIFITYWSNKRMYPIRKAIYRDYEIASGKMGQAIININAVQSFVQEENELKGFGRVKAKIRDNEDKQWGWMMKIGLGRNFIVDFGRAAVLFLGVYLVYKGTLSVGSLIFVFTLSEKAYASLFRLSRFYDRMEEGREGVNRLIALFNEENEIVNPPGGLKPSDIKGEIKFDHASFHYNINKRAAVSDLSFTIKAGSITALVGPSGGGKTTVARLVYRHYDPQVGRVLLDGKDLRAYDLRSFRKFLAIVPQEVEIFDLTVAANIAYARPEATRAEIVEAARIANADEFIARLDKGYDTLTGERGIKLSGGQRQRLGIARAILANPRVLIFDEATSNLDSQSEALIQDAIKKISRNRTMIIIAHRLSTIKQADKIVVLEGGKVVEEGSHKELASAQGGLYAKLLKLQALGEVD
ncbi:MAG: ABC transporter ATP-binding protein [Candidatus Falkowbacteria bacterium]|nr:ABC transporter ATP-binding protein [Candidatus Falkowbacteria bacterium]